MGDDVDCKFFVMLFSLAFFYKAAPPCDSHGSD